jgi:hypothetical protein
MKAEDSEVFRWEGKTPEDVRSRLVPKRFRVNFRALNKERFVYEVCTCLDARKALVMAATVHEAREKNRIYEVEGVMLLPGDKPLEHDIIDRAEW